MDFEKVLPLIIKEFEKNNVRYALIGGFALGLLGVSRATVDIDFLVERDDIDKVENILQKFGYKCVYKTENVSQFVSGLKPFGEIDFLHAFREISKKMLKRAKTVKVFEGKIKLKVLLPEDIIGLKVQAIENDPSRYEKEMWDIKAIMERWKRKINWEIVKEYFLLFSREKEFLELKKRYGKGK